MLMRSWDVSCVQFGLHMLLVSRVTFLYCSTGNLYCVLHGGPQSLSSGSGAPAQIQMLTAGSAPPPSVMRKMESELGILPLASYGLTEVIR